MLRKLVATGIIFIAGYVVGVYFGFRAAVTDYVENDADSIEQVADEMYDTGGENLPQVVNDAIEEANENTRRRKGNTADGGSKGFQ